MILSLTLSFYMYIQSLINEEGLKSLQTLSDKAQKAQDDGEPEEATKIWDEMENAVEKVIMISIINNIHTALIKLM